MQKLNYPSLIMLSILSVAFMILSFSIEKGAGVIMLNKYHTDILDIFFELWTKLGEAVSYLLVLAFILLKKREYLKQYAVAFFVQIITVLLMKHYFFAGSYRPSLWFDANTWASLHKIEGFVHGRYHSFPSGHTMTAFLTASFTMLYLNKHILVNVLLMLAALLVACSRVYLLQHFVIDVAFGMTIGFACAIISIVVSYGLKK